MWGGRAVRGVQGCVGGTCLDHLSWGPLGLVLELKAQGTQCGLRVLSCGTRSGLPWAPGGGPVRRKEEAVQWSARLSPACVPALGRWQAYPLRRAVRRAFTIIFNS